MNSVTVKMFSHATGIIKMDYKLCRDEVTGGFSPNIIRQIKSRRMRWAGHVARMGKERNVYRVLI
jgi:hypothetical protein